MTAMNLRKQQALDVDPRAIQEMSFTANFDRARKGTRISLLKKQKKLS